MITIMNDPEADEAKRDRMAIAAAPFVHPRASDLKPGKKEAAQIEAEAAGEGTDWLDDLDFIPTPLKRCG